MFKFRGGRPPGFGTEVFSLLSVYAWFALRPPPPPPQDTFTIQLRKEATQERLPRVGGQIVFSAT